MKDYRPILTSALVLALSTHMALPASAMPYALNIESTISRNAKITVRVNGNIACTVELAANKSASCVAIMDSTDAPVSIEASIVDDRGRESRARISRPARSVKLTTLLERSGRYEIDTRAPL